MEMVNGGVAIICDNWWWYKYLYGGISGTQGDGDGDGVSLSWDQGRGGGGHRALE